MSNLATMQRIPLSSSSINLSDVFLLDFGGKIYMYRSSQVENILFFSGLRYAKKIVHERQGKTKIIDLSSKKFF